MKKILLIFTIALFSIFVTPKVNAASYQVFIQREGAGTIACDVTPLTTILELKQMIFDSKGLEVDRQILTFAGNVLENDKIIADYNIQKDATISLNYLEAFTINFIVNGGSSVDNQTIIQGNLVERPIDPTLDGYTFDGWFTNSELTDQYDFSTPVTSNLTLYAKWVAVPNEDTEIKVPDTSIVVSITDATPDFIPQICLVSLLFITFLLHKKWCWK